MLQWLGTLQLEFDLVALLSRVVNERSHCTVLSELLQVLDDHIHLFVVGRTFVVVVIGGGQVVLEAVVVVEVLARGWELVGVGRNRWKG